MTDQKTKSNKSKLILFLLLLIVGVIVSALIISNMPDTHDNDNQSTSSSDETESEKSRFPFPPTNSLALIYTAEDYDGNITDVSATIEGFEEIDGEQYLKIAIGEFNDEAADGTIFYLAFSEDRQVVYKKIEEFLPPTSTLDIPFDTYLFDEPLLFYFAGAAGETRSTSSAGVVYFDGNSSNSIDITSEVTAEVISTDTRLTVPYGDVTGCRQLHLTNVQSDAQDPIESDLWFHPLLGLVKMSPLPGFEAIELKSIKLP